MSILEFIEKQKQMYISNKELRVQIAHYEDPLQTHRFPVLPLPVLELQNWHRYLDFIDMEEDIHKVLGCRWSALFGLIGSNKWDQCVGLEHVFSPCISLLTFDSFPTGAQALREMSYCLRHVPRILDSLCFKDESQRTNGDCKLRTWSSNTGVRHGMKFVFFGSLMSFSLVNNL